VEIRGVPFCEACACEQEAYFAIGELTQEETRDLRSEPLSKALGKTLGEMLDGMRRQRTDDLAAARCFDLPSVDETERLALAKKVNRANRVVAGTPIGGPIGWSTRAKTRGH